jgi:uncharacterized NAD-dependent epimerase/dehydratase family protein
MNVTKIKGPYLLFLGSVRNPLDAKTGRGLKDWRPELCLGQSRLPGCTVDLGLPDMTPAQAYAAGARSLVIGVAPLGGGVSADWVDTLVDALESGLDLVSGMHSRLGDVDKLRQAASQNHRTLVDIRVPPPGIPLATGMRRGGKRMLMVGTDCCVGKKYSALALHRALEQHGTSATFRATGQTGILIAGEGIPMDAVVSDFLAGAAEILSPANRPEHWDVIEGQGSLFHPAYAAVTLGLLHGSQPDALVLCHDAGREEIDDYPGFRIPPLDYCMRQYLEAARITNIDARFIGISVNTSGLDPTRRLAYLEQIRTATGLPCADPIIDGVDSLLANLEPVA